MVRVKKERYLSHPAPGQAAWMQACYVGPGPEREEVHSVWKESDRPEAPRRRVSLDNGRTWSGFESLPTVVTFRQGSRVFSGGGAKLYDPVAGALVEMWLYQTMIEKIYYNQTFYRLSWDLGKTWGDLQQFRYEEGDRFDPDRPLNMGFLRPNQGYFGNNILLHSNGTLVHCLAHANVPGDPEGPPHPERRGSLCFVGRWDAGAQDYAWTAGQRVWLPWEVSSRGLSEPEVAELSDGRVLVVWRGSNTETTPGRKWFSVSEDGGLTLSPVQEWKYEDGTGFYSPASYHRMIRSSVTGKLYWMGNITAEPPRGNSPRYPLVIAEVEEDIPALKKGTVTVVDDRGPEDGPNVQMSNFSLLEDRETRDLEVYLTRIGEDPDDFWGADVYRYALAFE